MNSSDHLAARHIGGYTPSLIEERWTGPLHGRLIRTLHLAEKGIPRFRIAHLGRLATDGNVAPRFGGRTSGAAVQRVHFPKNTWASRYMAPRGGGCFGNVFQPRSSQTTSLLNPNARACAGL